MKKISLLRKILTTLIATCLVVSSVRCLSSAPQDVFKQVVKLESSRGSCSGEQIKAKSGITYILTAAHCRVLEENGSITVKAADGRSLQRRVIAIDKHSDLMLIEGIPGLEGLTIAKQSFARDDIETYTHGSGYPSYKTEGTLIGNIEIEFPIDIIASEEDEAKCSGSDIFKISEVNTIFGSVKVCMFKAIETATTALIVPGSSGGAVVNKQHELVGVVSAGNDKFGFLVRLQDIQAFLANY